MYAPAQKTHCHPRTHLQIHSAENQSNRDKASTSRRKSPDKTPAPPAIPTRRSSRPSTPARTVSESSENALRDTESSPSRARRRTARCSPSSPHTNRRNTASDAETLPRSFAESYPNSTPQKIRAPSRCLGPSAAPASPGSPSDSPP